MIVETNFVQLLGFTTQIPEEYVRVNDYILEYVGVPTNAGSTTLPIYFVCCILTQPLQSNAPSHRQMPTTLSLKLSKLCL